MRKRILILLLCALMLCGTLGVFPVSAAEVKPPNGGEWGIDYSLFVNTAGVGSFPVELHIMNQKIIYSGLMLFPEGGQLATNSVTKGKTTVTRRLTKVDFTVEITGFSKDNNFNNFYPVFLGFNDDLSVTSTHSSEHTNCPIGALEDGDRLIGNMSLVIDGASGDMSIYDEKYSHYVGYDERVLYVYVDNFSHQGDQVGRLSKFYPAGVIWDYNIWSKWEADGKYMTIDMK